MEKYGKGDEKSTQKAKRIWKSFSNWQWQVMTAVKKRSLLKELQEEALYSMKMNSQTSSLLAKLWNNLWFHSSWTSTGADSLLCI